MTQYTQGPIANTGAAYGNSGLLLTANNDATPMFVVCHYFEAVAKRKDGSGVTYRERPEGVANAARLVACWNACEGMDDPAAELATLRAQRDALVSACQSAAAAYQSMFSVMPVAWQTIDDEICAALDGAK